MNDSEFLKQYLNDKANKEREEEQRKLERRTKWNERIAKFNRFIHKFGIHTYRRTAETEGYWKTIVERCIYCNHRRIREVTEYPPTVGAV